MIYIYQEFDTEQEALDFREAYYQNYHPMGYGTHIKVEYSETKQKWIADGARGSSAD